MARPPFQNEHGYAVEQEVMRHDDAINQLGEMSACIMLWHLRDHEADLVDRCPECYTNDPIADVYGQSQRKKCPNCYGTTFEGGIRAILYRPSLWEVTVTQQDGSRRGDILTATASVQVVSGFFMREGDWVVRSNGTRWQITVPQENEMTTGFGPKAEDISTGTGFSATLEDPSSVAYTVPLATEPFSMRGWSPYMLYPTEWDIINGPLNGGIDEEPYDGTPTTTPPGSNQFTPAGVIYLDANEVPG